MMSRLFYLLGAGSRRRHCMHHRLATAGTPISGPTPAESWIVGQLINNGQGKMFTCQRCGQRWFV